MSKHNKIIYIIFITFLLSNVIVSLSAKSCKDIIAVGDATDGDYNLLLKVRDPSRPGLQVLCIVPEGYEYTYNHPWTGRPMEFKTKHKYIGVASKGDTIPNIVKAGMSLSDAGISYGDADTGSNWKNPTRNAWDDFDWIRYACEKADDEDEAVLLMTKDCVDQLHASGVSENLFIVGPKKAFVIEADAFHYNVKEINDIVVMSNYPKELWKTQRHKKLPIAASFDIEKERYVRKWRTLRLNSLYGVKIVGIGEDWIVARQHVPFFNILNKMIKMTGGGVKIQLGERKNVGDYSVKLLDIDGKKAKISVSYVFKAWEDIMLQHIEPRYGHITLKDMINWSRLHREELENLRPMCEDLATYESSMIYKIPKKNYHVLSSGWFSANRACSSIYVPVHISNSDIYEPYKTGQAAEISIELLDHYGHDTLTPTFIRVEDVFLNETLEHEKMANTLIEDGLDVSEFLTIVDTSIQEQAWLTEQIWLEVSKSSNRQEIIDIIGNMWGENYSVSLGLMASAVGSLRNISESKIISKITNVALNICESRINAVQAIGKNISTSYEDYTNGKKLFEQGDYGSGFQLIKNAFRSTDLGLVGNLLTEYMSQEENEGIEIPLEIGYIVIVFAIVIVFIIYMKKMR